MRHSIAGGGELPFVHNDPVFESDPPAEQTQAEIDGPNTQQSVNLISGMLRTMPVKRSTKLETIHGLEKLLKEQEEAERNESHL